MNIRISKCVECGGELMFVEDHQECPKCHIRYFIHRQIDADYDVETGTFAPMRLQNLITGDPECINDQVEIYINNTRLEE